MAFENLKEFNEKLRDFAEDEVPRRALLLFRRVALGILRRAVLKTPVDTGRARGNWQLTVNRIVTSVIDRVDDGSPSHSVGEAPRRGAGKDTVDKGLGKLSRVKLGDTIYITNNVDYIVYLEEGTEKIPPQKMLAEAIQEIEQGLFGEVG